MRRFVFLAIFSVLGWFLVAPPASAEGSISSLSVAPSMVRDGASATGTVAVISDGTETTALLFSSDPDVASVPASVVVPAGSPGQESSVTFTITTNANAPETSVQITAAVGGIPRTANLSVNAQTPPGPQLSAVSTTPSTVTGGSAATGKVTFSGATDGAVVQLASSNPAVLQVPASTVVPGGASTGAFSVATSAVAQDTVVTITASWFAISKTTTVTVKPGQPAPPDVVHITTAKWDKLLLQIRATSTNPNAILSVYGRSGNFMFTLTNKGGGQYEDRRGSIFNPEVITVRSNFGGSDTANVTR